MRARLDHAESICMDLSIDLIWPCGCSPSGLVVGWQVAQDAQGVLDANFQVEDEARDITVRLTA